jgi:hypothetical protein
MKSISFTVIATLVWLIALLAIDRMLLFTYSPIFLKILALDSSHLSFLLAKLTGNSPVVSLFGFILVPMTALALYLIPWHRLQSILARREEFSS